MYTLSKDSTRVRNKIKGKRKRNKKVKSRNSGEESSYKHIDLKSNNSNESFYSEFSDTLNDDIRIKQVTRNVSNKLDHVSQLFAELLKMYRK